MLTEQGMQGGRSATRRTAPGEFLLLTVRAAREARTARAAAIGDTIVRALALAIRGVRLLWRWRQQRKAAADLHAMTDYSLRDIGIARSQIDERVRVSARAQRATRQFNRTDLRSHR